MRTDTHRLSTSAAMIISTLLLTACTTSTAPGSGGEHLRHNRADAVFVAYMIPHHQQGVDLAAIVPARTDNPSLVKLAEGIVSTQESEIGKMAEMLTTWSTQPDADADAAADASKGAAVTGKVDPSTFTKLGSLTGAGFDTAWLQAMIAHHRGALEMADTEIAHGDNSDALAMARKMVSAQQGQIDQMTKMLGG